MEVYLCPNFLIHQMRHWNCKRLKSPRGNPHLWICSPGLSPFCTGLSSVTLSDFKGYLMASSKKNIFNDSIKDLALQLSIISYIEASVPGLMFFYLTRTLVSPFSGWLRMLTHLQDSPWASPQGNFPDGLGWAECPFSGPRDTWAHPCRSIHIQNSHVSGAQSLHWCPACLLHPILPRSLSRLYPPQPTYPRHIPPTYPYRSPAVVTPAWIPLCLKAPSLAPLPTRLYLPAYIPPAYIPLWKEEF